VLENLSWAHMLVLLMAALFILGPERLPQSAAWLGRTIRQVEDFASGDLRIPDRCSGRPHRSSWAHRIGSRLRSRFYRLIAAGWP
jgi:hypothetical protein